ncbi:MAG: hypothetical protein AB7T22_14305 [Calditrichaceae bacterium]
MKEKKPQKIEFKIVEIKKISHFENDFSDYGLDADDVITSKMEIGLNLNIDGPKGTLAFNIKVKCFHRLEENNFLLFGIESMYKYRIKNLNKLFKDKAEDKYNFPDNLMSTLLNLAISGTRGMLAALNTTPAYQNIFLPIINPKTLLTDLKNNPL